MSNFLQRIAASAARGTSIAKPRLHPMLGSIYAPATPQAIESDAAAANEAYSEVAGGNASRAELLLPASRDNELYSSSSVSPRRFAPQGDGLLFPGELDCDVFTVSALSRPQRNEGETAQREPEASAQADKPHDSGAAESDFEKRARATHIQPPAAPLAIPVRSLRAAAPQSVDAAGRASAPRSEPDEIHIHIGKIEVAAIAPPPPRAAAPSPRKGINLDEYLRRGSGGRQ